MDNHCPTFPSNCFWAGARFNYPENNCCACNSNFGAPATTVSPPTIPPSTSAGSCPKAPGNVFFEADCTPTEARIRNIDESLVSISGAADPTWKMYSWAGGRLLGTITCPCQTSGIILSKQEAEKRIIGQLAIIVPTQAVHAASQHYQDQKNRMQVGWAVFQLLRCWTAKCANPNVGRRRLLQSSNCVDPDEVTACNPCADSIRSSCLTASNPDDCYTTTLCSTPSDSGKCACNTGICAGKTCSSGQESTTTLIDQSNSNHLNHSLTTPSTRTDDLLNLLEHASKAKVGGWACW